MTFTEFILSRHVTDTIRGDFIRDARDMIEIGRFPDPPTWDNLEVYLGLRHACPEAMRAGRQLWREFSRSYK